MSTGGTLDYRNVSFGYPDGPNALEGLDLPAVARIKDSGVTEVMPGVFETARAQRVGRQAEKELFGG